MVAFVMAATIFVPVAIAVIVPTMIAVMPEEASRE